MLTLRAVKGTELTWDEVDANFVYLEGLANRPAGECQEALFTITALRETLFTIPGATAGNPATCIKVYLNGLRERHFATNGVTVLLDFEPVQGDEVLVEFGLPPIDVILEPGIVEDGILEGTVA